MEPIFLRDQWLHARLVQGSLLTHWSVLHWTINVQYFVYFSEVSSGVPRCLYVCPKSNFNEVGVASTFCSTYSNAFCWNKHLYFHTNQIQWWPSLMTIQTCMWLLINVYLYLMMVCVLVWWPHHQMSYGIFFPRVNFRSRYGLERCCSSMRKDFNHLQHLYSGEMMENTNIFFPNKFIMTRVIRCGVQRCSCTSTYLSASGLSEPGNYRHWREGALLTHG